MASLLHAAPGVPEGILSDLAQLLLVQAQVVAGVGARYLLKDVRVIWGVPMGLGTVNETLDLTGDGTQSGEFTEM